MKSADSSAAAPLTNNLARETQLVGSAVIPPRADCNTNGVQDTDDILAGTSWDCNASNIPDECEIASGVSSDTNSNGVPDVCDVGDDRQRSGISTWGSILIFPKVEIRWDAAGNVVQDTFIALTNGYPIDVQVQMYFVNGDPPLPATDTERAHPGWNWVDVGMYLTGNQPTYWSAMSGQPAGGGIAPFMILDPFPPAGRPVPEPGGTDRFMRGYIVAWAVDFNGQEIRWNYLSGRAITVDYRTHQATEHAALAFRCVSPASHGSHPDGVPARLALNGVEYAAPPAELVFSFPSAGSSSLSRWGIDVVTDGALTLVPASFDFRQESTFIPATEARIEVWNASGFKFSGFQRCVTVWDHTLMSDYGTPNNFLAANLQTDTGSARIDGQGGFVCANAALGVVSADRPLVGLLSRSLDFGSGLRVAAAETVMTGRGAEAGLIQWDIYIPPPPTAVGSAAGAATASRPDPGLERGPEQQNHRSATGAERSGDPARVDASQLGSLLMLPSVELRWDSAGNLVQDTIIELTNDYPDDVTVTLAFVQGDPPLDAGPSERAHPGWNQHRCWVDLGPHQTLTWSANEGASALGCPAFTILDPDNPPGRPAQDSGSTDRVLRGYIVAWAVNAGDVEMRWNHLYASAMIVDYRDLSVWAYSAYAFEALTDVARGEPLGTPGQLALDGDEYDFAFTLLALNFFSAGSQAVAIPGYPNGINTDLTLLPTNIDLRREAATPVTTEARIEVWNRNEVKITGAHRCVTGWDQTLLSQYGAPNNFLRQTIADDQGRAQIDGLASTLCDVDHDPADGRPLGDDARDRVSAATPMLGVASRLIMFDDGNVLVTGNTLAGAGTEASTIRYTPFDCNANGVRDDLDIAAGTVDDCNSSGIPDPCEIEAIHDCCQTGHGAGCSNPAIEACVCAADAFCCSTYWDRTCMEEVTLLGCGACAMVSDCNGNAVPDACEPDCNSNGVADECDIIAATSADCEPDGVPDECEPDCNTNGVADACDLLAATSADCQANGIPDECEADFDADGLIDACDPDADGDGIANPADICPWTPAGQPVTPWGSPKGDADGDCAVTLADLFYFEFCLGDSGPGEPPAFQDCIDVFDLDADQDVDLLEFAVYQLVLSP